MIYWNHKTPAMVKDYGLNWQPFLSTIGDPNIVASSWSLVSGNVVLSSPSNTAKTTAVRVSGGDTVNCENIIRNHITLSTGEQYDADVYLKIRS